MLYLSGDNGNLKIIILESKNLEELKKGRPAYTPDGSVFICWTPDPEWLEQQIQSNGGDVAKILSAIDESVKRPQTELRPSHPPTKINLRRQ